jgi:hypothetical protein
MAEIRVEKKSMSPWAMWLIGLLVLLAIWFVWQYFSRDRAGLNTAATAPAAVTAPLSATPGATDITTTTPAGPTGTDAAAPADTTATTTRAPAGSAPDARFTDAGTYAATSDKLTLVGREAVLANVRVVRVVGPKSFTLASGSEELLVIIDPALNRGVGTQGQIDQGNTLNLKGNFQRIQPDEINTIASDRFRDLTEPEREWLKKTQVYLHATEFSKVN